MDFDNNTFPINEKSEQRHGFCTLGYMLRIKTIKEYQLKPRKLKNKISFKFYRPLYYNKKPLSFRLIKYVK